VKGLTERDLGAKPQRCGAGLVSEMRRLSRVDSCGGVGTRRWVAP
jgi:hypothetical protein